MKYGAILQRGFAPPLFAITGLRLLAQCFGGTNSKPYVGASAIIFWISLYGVSAGGGNVIDGAGTLHSLKNCSAPAGETMTSIRTCSESIANECGTSRGAKTMVPAVALIVWSPT